MEKILSNEVFLKDYDEYKKNIDVDKLRNFFNDIETNRNYFRLNLKKSKKFINKNNDTLTIKNINSNINKCTEEMNDKVLPTNPVYYSIVSTVRKEYSSTATSHQ